MRLIDGEKLISVFAERKEAWRGNGVLPSNESLMWLAAMDITSNAPTVEAVPVKHGRWINSGYACGEYKYVCSVCGGIEWRTGCRQMKYCMFCGAKMDLGGKE